jgi:hypothetical protein
LQVIPEQVSNQSVLVSASFTAAYESLQGISSSSITSVWACPMIFSTEMIVSNIVGGLITLAVALVVFGIQERRARRSFQHTKRFLENFAANRHNSADITFAGGTSVSPGMGEMKFEGYAPTIGTTKDEWVPSGGCGDGGGRAHRSYMRTALL